MVGFRYPQRSLHRPSRDRSKNAEGETEIYTSDTFYEDMFYIMWEGENDGDVLFSEIFVGLKAYDDRGIIVYDSDFPI